MSHRHLGKQRQTFISDGGTMGISTPYPYSYTAKSLVAAVARVLRQDPLADTARRDLIRIYGTHSDYMTGMSVAEKIADLARTSYQEFLLRHAKTTPEALPNFLGQGIPGRSKTGWRIVSYSDHPRDKGVRCED